MVRHVGFPSHRAHLSVGLLPLPRPPSESRKVGGGTGAGRVSSLPSCASDDDNLREFRVIVFDKGKRQGQ